LHSAVGLADSLFKQISQRKEDKTIAILDGIFVLHWVWELW